MSSHPLLTKSLRNLTHKYIAGLSDNEIFEMFAKLRWGSTTEVVCPECETCHQAYFLKTRRQWRCKHCGHTFSVTSGTMFAYHKLPLRTYLDILVDMINHNGIRAISIMASFGLSYKTAFVMLHKFREMMREEKPVFSGVIQIDGLYVKTHTKAPNRKEDKGKYIIPDQRRCVLVMRELSAEKRDGRWLIQGGKQTRAFMMKTENKKVIFPLIEKYIKKGSTIYTDGSPVYKGLAKSGYDWECVLHKNEFNTKDGINNNQAESFFSRFRHIYQIHHQCCVHYLENYVVEAVFREDHRYQDRRSLLNIILKNGLTQPPCPDWKGYFQGSKHKKREEELVGGA